MKEVIETIVIPVEIVCNAVGCSCKRVASARVFADSYEPLDTCTCGHPPSDHLVEREL